MKKTLIVICALLFIPTLFCELPVDPAKNPANASAKFTTINNAAPVSLNEVIANATVAVGFNLYLPDFIDSVKLTIISSQQNVERTYVIKAPWSAADLSTPIIFPSAGTKTCVLTCFRSNGTTSDVSLIFVVAYQPGNHPPAWSPDTVEFTSQKESPETLSLLPYAKDPDGNPISFTIAPPGSQFSVQDSRISAMASIDTGRYFISVIISDGELQDTGIVAWKIFAPQTVHATLTDDSARTTIDSTITVDVLANDAISSGTLLLSSVTQPASGLVAIKSNKAVYIPARGFTGVDTFYYIVNGIDTGSVTVSVVATTIPSATDTVPPAMRLVLPQIDSAAVNASSATISIEAIDASGIASVVALFGAVNLIVSAAAPVYSVTITNLPANQFNTIRFIATDSSGNGNRETLLVAIKYDPSISDATGPVFKQISGPVSGSVITNPLVTIVDSITDPSGIDSVFWSLNGGPVKLLTAIAGKPDQFSLTATVERENLDTIIITAVDKSAKRNRSTRVVVLEYVVAPVISAQSSSQTVCAGTPVTFSVTASGTAPLSYQWRKGSEENLTDIASAINATYDFTPGAADNGAIYSCIVNNGSNVTAVSAPITLTVNSASTKPAAVATPATICTGGSSILSVSAGTLGSGASWKWYTAKSSTTALTSLTVSPTSSKWYYVKGTGGLCGDSPWDSAYVTVNSQSIVPTGITTSAVSVCSGSSVTLTQTGGTLGTGATWQWFIDSACTLPAAGTLNGDGSQITLRPTSTTTYYLQAEGDCNTTTAMSKTITVSTPSNPPTSIAANSSSVCPGSSITLIESGGSLGTGAAWKWYTNSACTQAAAGTLNADGTQLTVTPSAQTTYYVRAEGATCGNTTAASRTISVNTPPTFSEQLAGMEVCEPGADVQMYYNVTVTGNSPFTYVWYYENGTELGRGAYIYVPAPTAGPTRFYCVSTDVNGCSTQSNTANQVAHQPTIITRQPEGDGGYQVWTMSDTVMATGDGLNYEWQSQRPNGGAWEVIGTGTSLSIDPADLPGWEAHWGTYVTEQIPIRVKITNRFGCEKISNTAYLSISWGI